MKKYAVSLLWTVLLLLAVYMGYSITQNIYPTLTADIISLISKLVAFAFLAGLAVSGLVYEFLISHTSTSLNMYKRELEKEAIDKTESNSRVKVLESKIQVLEKALDEALKK